MALKKSHLELLDFSTSYSLPYCEQCGEGSDSHVNKVSKTIDIEYTENNITKSTSRHCTHTEISTSTAGIPTVILFGSLDMCVKDEIVLSPRMLGHKSWVGGGVPPIKSHEGVAIEAVGENCQSVSRVSKLNPSSKFPFFPEMLFVQEYSTFKCLLSRCVLLEVFDFESISVEFV